MKNFFKIAVLTGVLATTFLNIATAQLDGNSFGAGDQNLGDLDQLETSVGVTINLETILQLNGPDNPSVNFVFDEMEEFKNGIKAEDPTNGGAYISAGVNNGIHKFGVDATVNWKLDWRANITGDFVEGVNSQGNRKQELAVNNVGALFNTDNAQTAIVPSDKGAIALSSDDFTVIKREGNESNIGDSNDNNFLVTWRVGTQEQPDNPSTPAMNEKSLLEQQIGSEAFKFEVVFTLSQDDPWIQ